ncbi:hypothetical protein GF360_03380 [candidate division WWE3 bacterium]|nr:hypothetical protein [candidate division WWE3 bacterium]
MNKKFPQSAEKIFIILIILLGAYFRLAKLGYSDFQGDEVAAQNYLFGEQEFFKFIFTRTKGPGQYAVSALANIFAYDFNVENLKNIELYVRLPFALTGIALLPLLYFFVRKHKDKMTALLATSLISLSGLMIAFSRIVQYQVFVILISVIVCWLMLKYAQLDGLAAPAKSKQKRLLILSGVFSGVGLLFHYDSFSFILPILFLLMASKRFKPAFIYIATTLIMPAIYFTVLFLRTPEPSEIIRYLLFARIQSDFIYDNIFYSIKILKMYHPLEFLILSLVGCFLWIYRQQIISKHRGILVIGLFLLGLFRYFRGAGNELLYISSLVFGLAVLVSYFFGREFNFNNLIVGWFVLSLVAYFFVMEKALTHIYVVFIPASILFASQLAAVLKEKGIVRNFLFALLVLVLFTTTSFNFQAFIDTTPEYPWHAKKYILGFMPANISSGERVEGIFGFPYSRNWKDVRKVALDLGVETYYSNEKYRLAKYYMQGFGWNEDPEVFIYIEDPQSLSSMECPSGEVLAKGDGFLFFSGDVVE